MTTERTDDIERAVVALNDVSRDSGAAAATSRLNGLLGHPVHRTAGRRRSLVGATEGDH